MKDDCGCERPFKITEAPSWANSDAIAKPIPAVEPVTGEYYLLTTMRISRNAV